MFPLRFRFRFGKCLYFNSLRVTDPQKHPFSTCFQFHLSRNSLIHNATANVTAPVAPMVAGESEGVAQLELKVELELQPDAGSTFGSTCSVSVVSSLCAKWNWPLRRAVNLFGGGFALVGACRFR